MELGVGDEQVEGSLDGPDLCAFCKQPLDGVDEVELRCGCRVHDDCKIGVVT